MSLDQLVFDTTDSLTMEDSSNVGAWVRSSDGTLIDHATINSVNRLAVDATLKDGAGTPLTSTTVGAKQALDVNLASPLTVDTQLEGVYDAVNNTNPDNVGIIAHSRSSSLGDVQQIERTTAAGIATVTSANLNTVNALDVNAFAYLKDANGDMQSLAGDASGNLLVNVTNDIVVSDKADTAVSHAATQLTTAGTAQTVVGTPLANRKFLFIYNKSNRKIYIGGSGVSTSDGFPISPKSYMELRVGSGLPIYFNGPSNNQEIRVLELA